MEDSVLHNKDDDDEKLLNELNATFAKQHDPNDVVDQNRHNDDDDDIFLFASKRQEQLAEERRLQRRKRLREMVSSSGDCTDSVMDDQPPSTMLSPDTSTITTTTTTTHSISNQNLQPNHHHHHLPYQSKRSSSVITTTEPLQKYDSMAVTITQQHQQQQSQIPSETQPSQDTEENLDDGDDDEFDMFSSSVSPPNLLVTTNIHHDDTDQAHIRPPSVHQTLNSSKNQQQQQQQQDWDDSEGYYKAVIGETIDLMIHPSTNGTTATASAITTTTATTTTLNGDGTPVVPSSLIRIRVAGLIGKGVFSTVLKCTVISNNTSIVLPNTIAMKCIRHNDTMTKTALTTELSILQKLRNSPGIVSLLLPTSSSTNTNYNNSTTTNNITPLEYRGHVLFVFPCMEYNLRDVLQKFGKGIGISLPAVRSYFGQLLAALSHLHKFHIIHADIKPDNVLVSADFAVIQIADFGSAMDLQSPDPSTTTMTHPTPYLVSRFYRAPEIILGLVPITHMIDLWSVAVTVAELFIGDVLFRGTSNNDMLYVFQQHLGPLTNRMIRQHLIQCQKFGTGSIQQQQLSPHFQLLPGTGNSYHFTQRTTDTVTGVPVLKVLSLVVTDTTTIKSTSNNRNMVKFPLGTPISTKLLKAKSTKDSRKMVYQFIDLLTKCLMLDPNRRISLKDALRHEFFIVNTNSGTSSTTTGSAGAGVIK